MSMLELIFLSEQTTNPPDEFVPDELWNQLSITRLLKERALYPTLQKNKDLRY